MNFDYFAVDFHVKSPAGRENCKRWITYILYAHSLELKWKVFFKIVESIFKAFFKNATQRRYARTAL